MALDLSTGKELATQIGVWLKYGHIVDPSESDEELNAAVRPIRAVKVSLEEAKQRSAGADGQKKGLFGLF